MFLKHLSPPSTPHRHARGEREREREGWGAWKDKLRKGEKREGWRERKVRDWKREG